MWLKQMKLHRSASIPERLVDKRACSDRRSLQRPSYTFGRSAQASLCGKAPGDYRVAHPKPQQGVLEPRGLSDVEEVPLPLVRGCEEVAEAAERLHIAHRHPYLVSEEVDRSLQVALLVVEVGEHAGGERSAPTAHEQIGVALGRQLIRENAPGPVRMVGREEMTDGHCVGAVRPKRQDAASGKVLLALAETDIDPRRLRLLLQRPIQRPLLRPAPDEMPERFVARAGMGVAVRVEDGELPKRRVAESRLDPHADQFVEDVLLRGPVLQPLEIAVEPLAHSVAALVNNGPSPARATVRAADRPPGPAPVVSTVRSIRDLPLCGVVSGLRHFWAALGDPGEEHRRLLLVSAVSSPNSASMSASSRRARR